MSPSSKALVDAMVHLEKNPPKPQSKATSGPVVLSSPLRYRIVPVGVPDALPITSSPQAAGVIAAELEAFLLHMEEQGYWQATDEKPIPLAGVTYRVEVATQLRSDEYEEAAP